MENAHNKLVGQAGEQLATAYFRSKGFTVLAINWRWKHIEIDIIANKNDVLHIIEVKTRTTTGFGQPEHRVTKAKIKLLKMGTEEYLIKNPQWKHIQFDVLAIEMLQNGDMEYFLIEDIT